MKQLSRREFAVLAGAGVGAVPLCFGQKDAALTAQDVVDRIKKNVGVEWKADTVDTFKAGDPSTVVKGIVTTSMATMDVLQQAVKAGANLVITCEPTFYSKADSQTPPAGRGGRGAAPAAPPPADPVLTAKNEFIRKNDLVVWRFSDHWRLRKPDPLAQGLNDALGWSKYRAADDPLRFTIPSITLDALASELKKKLNARGGIRVVGDPQTKVAKVGLLPGTTPIQASLKTMPGVDVVIAGEVREWESVEYAQDTVASGQKKGMILLGRVISEEPGMNVCAAWLKTFISEAPVKWISVGDPYWRPA